jgi:hypothetical protein
LPVQLVLLLCLQAWLDPAAQDRLLQPGLLLQLLLRPQPEQLLQWPLLPLPGCCA